MQNERRRELLRSIATTSGIVAVAAIPTKWSKPIVDAVILPAHAQTSSTTAAPNPTTAAPSPTSTTPTPTMESIECSVTNTDTCSSEYMIFGQVNGGDASGQTVNIVFTGSDSSNMSQTFNFQATVQSGNQYSTTVNATPAGGLFTSGQVSVSLGGLSDSKTFGTPTPAGLTAICHFNDPNGRDAETLFVTNSEIAGHLSHGDLLGDCDSLMCGGT